MAKLKLFYVFIAGLFMLFVIGCYQATINISFSPTQHNQAENNTVATQHSDSDQNQLSQLPVHTPESKLFNNSKYGFSVKYPAKWYVYENYRSLPVVFIGPKETNNTITNISIRVEKPVNTEFLYTLDDFIKEEKLRASREIKNFQVMEEHYTEVDGQPAYISYLTGIIPLENGETTLNDIVASFVKDGTAYSITLDTTDNYRDKYVDSFNLVVNSFKFNTN